MKLAGRISLTCLAFASASHPALAWNGPGHMAVAALAFDELSPTQQAKLANILRDLPDLNPIQSGFPTGAITDRELVMAAATWPDLIKQIERKATDPPQAGLYLDNKKRETLASLQNIDYSDYMHKSWHYEDRPIWLGPGPKPAKLPKLVDVNAVSVTDALIAQLHQNEPNPRKAYQLVWLLHLSGDLHQPLHNANGCTPTFPKGDGGGNSVTITAEKKKDAQGHLIKIPEATGESELHAFWDDIGGKKAKGLHLDQDILTANSIETAAKAVHLTSTPPDGKPQDWSDEGFKLANSTVYKLTLVPGQNASSGKKTLKATITKTYADAAHKAALAQIKAAGHRLATVLKSIL